MLATFTLARLKAVCAFLGAVLTYVTTIIPACPTWVTVAAPVATFVSVYGVPNVDLTKSNTATGDGDDEATDAPEGNPGPTEETAASDAV